MIQTTCDIIKACKNPKKYKAETELEAVKRYMAEECDCPLAYYTDSVMEGIMLEAMYDYIDSCDKPSSFLRQMNTLCNVDKLSLSVKIARTFMLVQVRSAENKEWINGFTEELWFG